LKGEAQERHYLRPGGSVGYGIKRFLTESCHIYIVRMVTEVIWSKLQFVSKKFLVPQQSIAHPRRFFQTSPLS
jgi:hypothetical protein